MKHEHEHELGRDIQALSQRVAELERDVAEMRRHADYDRDNMFKFVLDRFKQMDVYLFGCFNKLFPGYAKSAEEFETLIGWEAKHARHSYGTAKDGKEIL